MPVPTTNVTFSSIQAEFGGANPVNMSEYYRGGSYVGSGVATSGTDGNPISTSGAIRVGMFRGVAGVSYAIAINAPSTIDEGASRNFTVTTTGVANGTVLYWTVSHFTTAAADFVSTSGSVTVNSNTATGVIQITADATTEGSQSFALQLRTGSTSGTIVATSTTSTINDTSLTPSNTPTGNNWEVGYLRFGVAIATATFTASGTMNATGQGSQTLATVSNWYTPTTAGIGSSYWIRFTQVSGFNTGILSGDALNTWHQLNTSRALTLSTGTNSEDLRSFTVQISTTSNGSNIVSTNQLVLEAVNSQM